MPAPDLLAEARTFAAEVGGLLNRTITTGVSLSAVLHPSGNCWVARGITKRSFDLSGIAVRLGRGNPPCYVLVAYVLQLDPEGQHLAVTKSNYGVYLDEALEQVVLHYDYEREPANEYPSAHIQIHGESTTLQELCRRAGVSRDLGRFHFPVGGRRFRPTLEDLIEFLVIEGLAEPREGWQEVVGQHRSVWETRQLCAAVRRNPGAAANQLRAGGWACAPPPDDKR